MDRRKFIMLTGSGTAFIAGSGIWFSCRNTKGFDYETQLKDWSLKAFTRFESVWDYPDFWKRGNTFDACLTFVSAVQDRWPEDPKIRNMQQSVKEMLRENLLFFNSVDPGRLWADDFGWWGIMALNARKFLLRSGEQDLAREYLKLSTELCWEYKKNIAYDHTPDAKPVPHGCRNGDAYGESPGVKNTVTNVLLFLLSSRIYRLTLEEKMPDNEKYLEMAYRQWVWFDEWFKLKDYEFLKMISPDAGLVQERPMAFFEGSGYTEKVHPPWAEGWIWSGDQGMLLQAFADMLAVKEELALWLAETSPGNNFDKEMYTNRLRELMQIIGGGIRSALVSKEDGIFREAPFECSFGPQHGRDYLAGRGILMRYLANEEVKSLTGDDFHENIKATMTAIWETRDISNNQFQAEFTDAGMDSLYIDHFRILWGIADDNRVWQTPYEDEKMMVCQSIGLDALGAAVKLLPTPPSEVN
jgi:hypothetical protein